MLSEVVMLPLLLPDWLDPAVIIHSLGNWALWGVAFIVFIECAIFPVLPGDSLLFTVGMFVAMNPPSITFPGMAPWEVLVASCAVLTVAAVAGNVAGYWLGHFIGPKLFKPREGLVGKIFAPKHVDKTHELLERYGNRALILARFVPFVRTFVTLIAGIGKMSFRAFITYTAIGGVIWAIGVTVAGFFLGNIPFIRDNIDAVLVMIVLVSLIPMGVEYLLARRRKEALAE
ncbi:MAG: VTT domain-containing protein [Propionibacteriaceae bacterium]|jgi:membrane-associated protein|nr:VTT domain-containing protein [Propionibacteriaceae bacterium]